MLNEIAKKRSHLIYFLKTNAVKIENKMFYQSYKREKSTPILNGQISYLWVLKHKNDVRAPSVYQKNVSKTNLFFLWKSWHIIYIYIHLLGTISFPEYNFMVILFEKHISKMLSNVSTWRKENCKWIMNEDDKESFQFSYYYINFHAPFICFLFSRIVKGKKSRQSNQINVPVMFQSVSNQSQHIDAMVF